MSAVAALAMYDLPELRAATDSWWHAIARALRAEGLADVPPALDRARPVQTIWRDPALLLTQTCGYPLMHEFADVLSAVAVPSYAAEGCAAGRYRSAFVVRDDDPAVGLADLRGRRAAANGPDSQSGCNVLRAAVAPLAGAGRFFGAVVWSGAHRASAAAVRTGAADIAAIDAVTFALLRRYAPAEVDGLRVLDWSAEAPALPYATRRDADAETRARITAALLNAAEHPDAAAARAGLLLTAVAPIDDGAYAAIPAMRRTAERLGYPELA
ncbi:phosphate ABC transporter substrate-binding protein [Thalassobaculum fulvum]|uniref:Phosphate ABC transporter substrate-binding protein n=1 Tax=Thalassobaculum fulvum TaxID=1633335 RepID=A0A919CPZ0_9PROT|nr:PhnD/SsuA/transferrin family substrate-binding protein [Thalassobaculum fulvum]GHD51552.1 phosphate ABC transporter substrate-binding protein [Thalassobaculum fulvum]